MTNRPLPTAADVLAEAYAIVRAPCSAAETQRATLLFEIARELRCAADMRELRAHRAASEVEVAKRKLRDAGIMPGQLVPDDSATDWAATARDLTSGDPERVAQHLPPFATGGVISRKPAGAYSLTFEGENAAARAARLLRERAPEMQWPEPAGGVADALKEAATEPEQYVDRSIWDRAVAPAGVEGLAEGVIAAAKEAATATFPALADQTQRLPIMWSVGDKADCRHCHTPIQLFESEGDPQSDNPDQRHPWRAWQHRYTGQVACLAATMSSDVADVAHTFAEPAPR